MRDLPNGPALLALARDVLLADLLPLLPEEHRLDARLVANAMAVAEREAAAGDTPERAIARELEMLYRDGLQSNPSPQVGDPKLESLRRLAQDQRQGAFEGSPERERTARSILWRLTFARLREGNPRFLAANGFS
jgi:Domain of unknown function (DUF6285)